MGASFRNTGQIIELAGCDLLTISPELMKELSESTEPVERKLIPEKAKSAQIERLELDEKKFRYLVNDNAMATDKTSEGIRKFAADVVKLEKLVAKQARLAGSKERRVRKPSFFPLNYGDPQIWKNWLPLRQTIRIPFFSDWAVSSSSLFWPRRPPPSGDAPRQGRRPAASLSGWWLLAVLRQTARPSH